MSDYNNLKRYAENLAATQHAYGEGEAILLLIAENESLRNLAEFRKQDLESLSIENYQLKKHIDEIAIGFKADVDALRKDAERYRWLRDQKPNSFSVSRNEEHAPNYMTAEQWIDNDPEEFKETDEVEVQRMKESNTIWALQIYPNTPVGFNKYYAATLDVLIDDEMSGRNDS